MFNATKCKYACSIDVVEPVTYDAMNRTERALMRDLYTAAQDDKCAYCGEPLFGPPGRISTDRQLNNRLFPNGFFTHPLHLHHSHKTGLTIGVVHSHCNAVLWQYHGE